MKSRSRRGPERGLTVLLGAIVAVFVIVAAAVGVKYMTGSLASTDGEKVSKKAKKGDKNTVLVEKIELSIDRPTVRAGEGTQLKFSVSPDNATDKQIKWTVSGGGGTVSDDGIFTPNAEAGKSTVDVTAKAADGSGISASVSVRVLEAIDPEQPMVAVTYDDGPNSETTPIVLDTLEENYAVATFFMQGQYISGNEAILKRSYEMGNEMANHSWDHPQLTKLGAEGIKKQLSDTDKMILEACGAENPILRPPYGAINDTVKQAAGKPIIMWSLDTLDWKTRDTQKTIDACMTAKDGDIILMHDIHQPTVDGAEDIITGLVENGFQLVTVSELYRYRKGDFSNGSVHYSMTAAEMKAAEGSQEGDEGTPEDASSASGTTGQQSTSGMMETGSTDSTDHTGTGSTQGVNEVDGTGEGDDFDEEDDDENGGLYVDPEEETGEEE